LSRFFGRSFYTSYFSRPPGGHLVSISEISVGSLTSMLIYAGLASSSLQPVYLRSGLDTDIALSLLTTDTSEDPSLD